MAIVSIIVPVYNSVQTLDRCMNSIISQTFPYTEVILVDDGSTDGSSELCDEWAERSTKVRVIHQDNAGVSMARNHGIEASSGDYLLFVDSDDWIDPDMVSALFKTVQDTPFDLAVCTFQFEYATYSEWLHIHELNCSVCDLLDADYGMTEKSVFLCSPVNKLYRRSLIVDHDIRFVPGMRFGEDFTFNASYLCEVNQIISIDRPLYHYDCSLPDSGVKKLYPDYDVFIRTMDDAFTKLRQKKGLNSAEFQTAFIADRWLYATDLCEQSDLLDAEKIDLLCKWFQSIPAENWSAYAQTTGSFSRYAEMIFANGGQVRQNTIRSVYEKNLRIQNRKKRILSVKKSIQKVIGKK